MGKKLIKKGKTFFSFGGASSHDKDKRKEHVSWWEEELPNEEELKNAHKNLSKVGYNVDYVLTHCASNCVQEKIANIYETNHLTVFFDDLEKKLTYKEWFFGHYHIDKKIDEAHTCVYNKIIAI